MPTRLHFSDLLGDDVIHGGWLCDAAAGGIALAFRRDDAKAVTADVLF